MQTPSVSRTVLDLGEGHHYETATAPVRITTSIKKKQTIAIKIVFTFSSSMRLK
ncbi:MAG: hypothetical protein R2873_01545 [Caldilineaceae bacterium]